MARRTYCPGPWPSSTFALPVAEAHHLRDVLRQTVGAEVTLFDGAGTEAVAEIIELTAQSVLVRILRTAAVATTSAALTLAVAFPKGDRSKWLIEKITELGVTRCQPLITERTIVDPGAGKLDKLRHTIVEASKQCGRNDLLELLPPVEFRRLLGTLPDTTTRWMAAPGGKPVEIADFQTTPEHLVLIGPEGGFSPAEVAFALEHQTRLLGFGQHILRIETAAVAAASLWSASWPSQMPPTTLP